MSKIENGILLIYPQFEPWRMQIHLKSLVETTGVIGFVDWGNGRHTRQVLTKKSEARKLLKYILPYVDTEDLLKMVEIFSTSELLTSIFLDVVKKGKRFYELDNGSDRN